jgi:hypothetical protein
MIKILRGEAHGKTIELDEDLGVVEGQEVEVQVTMIDLKKRLPGPPPGWQAGRPSATAGRLAESWTAEDDRILDEIYRERNAARDCWMNFLLDGSFWESVSLDDLAKQQGVAIPRCIDDLLGGWPADELDDEFGETLRRWRESESRQGNVVQA